MEIIKNYSPGTKFFQPFSSNMFGNSHKKKQNEKENFSPLSIYALGKVTSYYACQMYRDVYGLKVYGAIFYNHESEIRSEEYVTRKITRFLTRKKVFSLSNKHLRKLSWCFADLQHDKSCKIPNEVFELVWDMINYKIYKNKEKTDFKKKDYNFSIPI